MANLTNKAEKPVTLKLQVTLTDAQGPMYACTHEWNNMPLAAAVYVEQELLQILTEMQRWSRSLMDGGVPEIPWR